MLLCKQQQHSQWSLGHDAPLNISFQEKLRTHQGTQVEVCLSSGTTPVKTLTDDPNANVPQDRKPSPPPSTERSNAKVLSQSVKLMTMTPLSSDQAVGPLHVELSPRHGTSATLRTWLIPPCEKTRPSAARHLFFVKTPQECSLSTCI